MMWIQIQRGPLEIALKEISKTVAGKPAMPVLNMALVTPTGATSGTMAATNMTQSTIVELGIGTDNWPEGGFLLPVKDISTILRRTKHQEIEIFVPEGAEPMIVKVGNAKFELPSMSIDEYPEIMRPKEDGWHSFEGVKGLLANVQGMTSKDDGRPHLCGAFIECGSGFYGDGLALNVVATDGHRLALSAMEFESTIDVIREGLIIPTEFIEDLTKSNEIFDEFSVDVEHATFFVRSADVIKSTKLIAGRFPSYRQVIPGKKDNDGCIQVDKSEILNALSISIDFANAQTRNVRCTFGEESITLETTTEDSKTSKQEVDCTPINGGCASVKVGFNAGYLAEAIRSTPGDVVYIHPQDELKPVLIFGDNPEGTDTLHIVMPMRL